MAFCSSTSPPSLPYADFSRQRIFVGAKRHLGPPPDRLSNLPGVEVKRNGYLGTGVGVALPLGLVVRLGRGVAVWFRFSLCVESCPARPPLPRRGVEVA